MPYTPIRDVQLMGYKYFINDNNHNIILQVHLN